MRGSRRTLHSKGPVAASVALPPASSQRGFAASRRHLRTDQALSRAERRKATALASKLIGWFTNDARDLPWRRTRDPYAIWVSEIMLQQTQVATVIPYFDRWLKALPTIRSLACAPSRRLHKLWEGLGYYSRVRNLQKAARQIRREHGGRFPDRFDDVIALPGIGRYTAGAICSIAFNKPTPILDGNVIRVLTRVFGVPGDPHKTRMNARLWQLAEMLVTEAARLNRNSEFGIRKFPYPPCSALNQSLMELGARICTPRNAQCRACPIRRGCVAYRNGLVDQLPCTKPRPATIRRHVQAFVVEKDGRCLAFQRPSGGVNGGLWEFHSAEVTTRSAPNRHSARKATDIEVLQPRLLGTFQHSITRYRIQVDAYFTSPARAVVRPNGSGRWLTMSELRRFPFSAVHRRIADTFLREHVTPRRPDWQTTSRTPAGRRR